jgi:hypothetical protein
METLNRPSTITGETIQSVLSQAAGPSEHLESFGSAERRVGPDDFEQVAVVLTRRRLLIVSPAKDLGFQLTTDEPRATCGVVSQADMPDQSRSVVVDAGGQYLGLHFPSSWRPEAETMLDLLSGRDATPEVDRFAIFEELSGLVDIADENAEAFG